MEKDFILTSAEFSKLVGISAESLARARQVGELRHTRKGRRILYLGQWILDWLEQDAKGVTDAK